MVLKKMLASLGAGNASVETILDNPNVHPGGTVTGRVHVTGGEVPQDITGVSVALSARVEIESGDSKQHTNMQFHRRPLWGAFTIQPRQPFSSAFTFDVPWEAPLTVIGGHHLRGMSVGVATDVEIAGAVDKGDLDPVAIQPLPSQERIINALGNLGFRFHSADLERGRLKGVQQTLPFYQEIEFYPPPQYAAGINQLEVTLVTSQHAVEVVMEFDRRGGLLSEGRDEFNRFTIDHHSFQQVDWENQLHQIISKIAQRRGIFF